MNFTKTFHAQGMENEENENTLQYFPLTNTSNDLNQTFGKRPENNQSRVSSSYLFFAQ